MEGVEFLLRNERTPPLPSLVRGKLRSKNTSYLHGKSHQMSAKRSVRQHVWGPLNACA